MKRQQRLFALWPAALPFLWVVMFWVYIVRARLHLGFWPYSGQHDPSSLQFSDPHSMAIYVLFPLALIAPFFACLKTFWNQLLFMTAFTGAVIVSFQFALMFIPLVGIVGLYSLFRFFDSVPQRLGYAAGYAAMIFTLCWPTYFLWFLD